VADQALRVLLVLGETTGGIGRHVALLAERLPRYDVDVAVAGPASALAATAGSGAVAHQIPVGVVRSALRARHALRMLTNDFDVFHAHGLRATALAASARRGDSPGLASTWHNAPLVTGLGGAAHRVLSRYAARAADVTLGASPDLAEAAWRAGSRDARDTFVVAPPLAAPTRTRTEVRAALGVGERAIVLAIGRLQAQKRLDVLVDAAAGWADRPDRPLVVIAGSGPDEAALRTRARERRAAVSFLGARADVPDLLAAADVVALPSAWEARSLVAQEALRAGVPLVTTPVGGMPALLGNAGMVFPVGDAARLRDALVQLTTTPRLAEEVAKAGLDQAASWPTIEDSLAELVATYRSLVAKSEDGGAS
jgi:glycosyltransferase involved in cell wall biosynthesis